jgi:hypothetical protein
MNDKELKKDFDSIFEGCEILDCPNCNNTGYYSSIHINKKTQEPEEVPVQCEFCCCEQHSRFNYNRLYELFIEKLNSNMAERIKENEYWKKYYESLTPDNLLWKNVLASLLEKHDERITELKTEA